MKQSKPVKTLAIIPALERLEDIVNLIPKLRSTANSKLDIAVIADNLKETAYTKQQWLECGADVVYFSEERNGYWVNSQYVFDNSVDYDYYALLASDVLPAPNWLSFALETARTKNKQLVGFGGDGWGCEHSCHFLVSYTFFAKFGMPTQYKHSFGDNELIRIANMFDTYEKSPLAVLYHNHITLDGKTDKTNDLAMESFENDARAYFS